MKDDKGSAQGEWQCRWIIVYTFKIYSGEKLPGPADRINMKFWDKGGFKEDYYLSA